MEVETLQVWGKFRAGAAAPRSARRSIPLALAALVACSALGGDDDERLDPALCPQTYEFGNFGCARLEGRVVDAAGRPVVGAYVRVDPAEGTPGIFDTPIPQTGDDGRYRLEIHAYSPDPRIPGSFDFVAHVVYVAGAGAGAGEAIPIRLEFVPVGERARVETLDVELDLP